MNKLIFSTLFLSIILTISCSISKPDQFSTDSSIPPDFAVTLERTGCFGKCPIYKLSVKTDGSVVFEGTKSTETIGKTEDKLSEAKVRELIKAFKEADYFGFEDSYGYDSSNCPHLFTDSPTAITSTQINNQRKSISHYLGCTDKKEGFNVYPAKLYELENKIDEIIGTKRWIGVKK